MVVKTVFAILLIFILLVVILPLVLNALGIPVGVGGSGGSSTSRGAGVSGVLLRSPDGGQQWQAVVFDRDNKSPLPVGIFDIAFHPSDQNVMFAGTASAGLWKSSDAGATWKKMNDAASVLQSGADVYKIAISAIKPDVMYLAVVQGNRGRVLRSDDAGVSFREIYAVTQDGLGVFDLYTAPTIPDDIMIATGEGRLMASRDGGKTWRIAHSFSASLATLAVNPGFTGERYVITSLGAITKTFDAGGTWADLGTPADTAEGAPAGQITHPYANWQLTFSSASPSFSFAIDPQNPAILYFTRADALFASQNGGFSWRRLNSLITGKGMLLGSVAAHPAREGTIFVTAGSDLYQSTDAGTSWSVKTISAGSSLQKIFISPRHPEIILVTTGR